METCESKENRIKAIGNLLQLLEVEHEGGVSHQVLRTLDGVVPVTRKDLLGVHLGRGDVLGLLNQPVEVDGGGDNQQ